MNLLEAFGVQVILFTIGALPFAANYYVDKNCFIPDKGAIILMSFMWLVLGTGFRYYTQISILGAWSYLNITF